MSLIASLFKFIVHVLCLFMLDRSVKTHVILWIGVFWYLRE